MPKDTERSLSPEVSSDSNGLRRPEIETRINVWQFPDLSSDALRM